MSEYLDNLKKLSKNDKLIFAADAWGKAIRHIEEIEKENAKLKEELDKYRWRSVEDELPEICDHTVILLIWDDGRKSSGFYIGSFQHANGDMDYHDEPKVTHWMPMPKFEGKK